MSDAINNEAIKNMLDKTIQNKMDKKITKKDGMYSIGEGDIEQKVLRILDQLFKEKPKIPLSKVMEQIPFTISKAELLEIVENSQNYYTPNGVIISKK